MDLVGNARRVRIYLGETALIGREPAYAAVVEYLRRENAAGVTVLRAVEGYGGSGEVHGAQHLGRRASRPVIVEWIDTPARAERLLPPLLAMLPRGLVTVDETRVLLYSPERVREVSSRLTAGDVMSRDVAAVPPALPVAEVVQRIFGKPYRAVPVVDGERLVGIVSNTDLVTRGGLSMRVELLAGLDAPGLQAELERVTGGGRSAGDVMTPDPVTVMAGATLVQVAERMIARRLKRLPVVDERGTLVGMVSRVDLLRTVAEGFGGGEPEPGELGLRGDLPLGRVMQREAPVTVRPETPLAAVLEAVVATRLGRVLVVDGERRVLGMVTDGELLERVTPSLRPGALRLLMHRLPFSHPSAAELAAERHATARTAAELMTTSVATASEETSVRDAIAAMLRDRHALLAVIDGERRLVGVVDRDDLLRALVALPT